MKKHLSLLLAVLMVLCISVTAFAANENDTSFTSTWTDEADDAWATVDDGTNVDVEIKDGVAALVLTGDASATSGHNVGAWYATAVGNASPRVVEFDFSVNDGGIFHVRGWNNSTPGYGGFTVTGNGGVKLVVDGNTNIAPDTAVTVAADTVHTIRIENCHSTNCAINGLTVGTKYYLDGELIYTTTNGAYYNKLSVCAGKNSTVKLYEIREWGGIRTWGANCGVTTNFTGKTVAEVEAEGRLSGIGTSDTNVAAEIASQTDDVYLALDRVGFINGGTAALASTIYTLSSISRTEEYNLNIEFMYKGRNAPEFRLTNGVNAWFTQFRIVDGKLQISSSGASTYDIKDTEYITPFTKHTITINGVPDDSKTTFSILLDGRVVAEGLTAISGGFGNTLPKAIEIYSNAQSVLSSNADTNMYLFGGVYIKSITVTAPEAEPDMAPVMLEDREIRFDGEGESITSSMRFKASVTPAQKLACAEYGMIVTRKSILTSLNNAELNFDLESGSYAYGIAYLADENGEPVIEKVTGIDDNGNEIFAAVLTGISNTDEAHVNEVFVVRPYIKVANGDETICFYGNTVEASLGEIAAIIDTSELSDEQKANIESILTLAK